MNTRTIKIIGWVLSGLISAFLLFSALGKLSGQMTEMMIGWGFTESEVTMIAVGEIISVILFLIPRTSSLGLLVLSAYMGGAIATHMQAAPPADSYVVPSIILVAIWIASALRVPGSFSSFTK